MAASYAQDSLKIGFSVGDFSSDRWSQEPQIFNEAAKSQGAKVLFEYAYGDAAKQLSQAGTADRCRGKGPCHISDQR